jgi:hypothetical protein
MGMKFGRVCGVGARDMHARGCFVGVSYAWGERVVSFALRVLVYLSSKWAIMSHLG